MNYRDKLLAGESVYLYNDYEQAVIKIVPGDNAYVKIKGKPEFVARPGSKLVADSKLDNKEITKEEYDNF